jgi:pimeloyl-ACP methyl ester carboxylesterase
MNFAAWLLLILAAVLLAAVLMASTVVKRHPQKVFLDPGQFGLDFEYSAFTSADGIDLVGWWIPAPGSTRAIICLHGYAGSCDPDLEYAPDLHAAGFNLLYFDFRAHGRSRGSITSIGALEVQDCLAAIRFGKEKGSQSIGLLGFSMGGRVAVLTAAEHPDGVKALISDGGPARLTTAIAADLDEKHVPGFLSAALAYIIVLGMSLLSQKNLFSHEPYNQASKLAPLPVLFIHGGRDAHTRVDELDRMVREAGEHAECWVVPQAGHRNVQEFVGEEYIQRVIAFFKNNL